MARKTKEETKNTKELILQSALDCFYEKGFSRTSFADIASRINLTKGAVYWHFKNKAELLVGLIYRQAQKSNAGIASRASNPESITALRNFFKCEAEYIENTPELQKFIFFTLFQVEWSDSVFNEVENKIGEIRDFHFKTIKNALTKAQKNGEISAQSDISIIATIIVSAWRGLINSFVSQDLKFNLTPTFLEVFDAMVEKIETMKG